MDATFLTGTYTCRSFFDLPEPVADFGTLRFARLELRLTADPDGDITGFFWSSSHNRVGDSKVV